MLNPWVSLIVRCRWIFALLWVAMLVGAVRALPNLDFSFNIARMLRGEEARMHEIREFYTTFPPADGHLMVSATADGPLTVNDLHATARWADQVRKLPEVRDVISADRLLDIELDGFTLAEWARLGGTGDEPLVLGDGPGMADVRGNFVSKDMRSVALYILKAKGSSSAFYRAVEESVGEPWPGAKVRVVGTDFIIRKMGVLLKENCQRLLKWQIISLFIIVPIFMRSLRRAYLPMLAAASALLAYFWIFITAEQEFGVMHLAGPGLILIIGLADAIHLQQKFDDARAEGLDVAASLHKMFQSVGRACALTSLTTACGFLSLTLARQEGEWNAEPWHRTCL